jgi:hypothetical protein
MASLQADSQCNIKITRQIMEYVPLCGNIRRIYVAFSCCIAALPSQRLQDLRRLGRKLLVMMTIYDWTTIHATGMIEHHFGIHFHSLLP